MPRMDNRNGTLVAGLLALVVFSACGRLDRNEAARLISGAYFAPQDGVQVPLWMEPSAYVIDYGGYLPHRR